MIFQDALTTADLCRLTDRDIGVDDGNPNENCFSLDEQAHKAPMYSTVSSQVAYSPSYSRSILERRRD